MTAEKDIARRIAEKIEALPYVLLAEYDRDLPRLEDAIRTELAPLLAAAKLADYIEPHVTEHGKGPTQVGSIGIESKDQLFPTMVYRAERNNAARAGRREGA